MLPFLKDIDIPEEFKDVIFFQDDLFALKVPFEYQKIKDNGIIAASLAKCVQIRPHSLDLVVSISVKYCENIEFKRVLLQLAFKEAPVLIRNLYVRNVYEITELLPLISQHAEFIHYCYFAERMGSYSEFSHISMKYKTKGIDFGSQQLQESILYGYPKRSIEYSLKYDDIEILRDFYSDPNINNKTIEWSIFEWALPIPEPTLLKFSAYFGSINCFKYLVTNGSIVEEDVVEWAVSSGNIDLVHLAYIDPNQLPKMFERAMEYYQTDIIDWIISIGLFHLPTTFNPLFVKFLLLYDNSGNSDTKIRKIFPNIITTLAKFGNLPIMKYFVNQGFDLMIIDDELVLFEII